MPKLATLLVLFPVLAAFFASASRARAEPSMESGFESAPPGAASRSLQPWRGSYLPAPSGPEPERMPALGPAPREVFRRPLELAGRAATLAAANDGATLARGVAPGLGAELDVSWRVGVVLAVGGALELDSWERVDPAGGALRRRLAFAGLLARAYLLGDGRLDPWVELAVGLALMQTALERGRARRAHAAGGRVGVGLDLYVSRRVRLGPSIHLLDVRAAGLVCDEGLGATENRVSDRGVCDRTDRRALLGRFGLGLTLSLGRPF